MRSRSSKTWQRWRENRDLAPFASLVAAVAEREEALSQLDDAGLRTAVDDLRRSAVSGLDPTLQAAACLAIVREAARRILCERAYDVQLLAALALARGHLVEMPTGEGKTLCAVHAACLLGLGGRRVHILTVNDYLARRDAAWMGPIYERLGYSVAHVVAGMSTEARRQAYACDILYVTAKEAGFDKLRDGLVFDAAMRVQGRLELAIVDEADSILIDEARIPLVLAGRDDTEAIDATEIAEVVRGLDEQFHYEIDVNARNVHLSEEGIKRVQELLRVEDLYAASQLGVLADVHNALHAEVLLERDVDYIVRDDRVELVDALTGRVAHDRLWPKGLQGAVEAKEGVHQRPEGRILSSMTMQQFIHHYDRICGMTATARSSAEEFQDVYDLRVVSIPSHEPCVRIDHPDSVFATLEAKRSALLTEIVKVHALGRPVLVGTESIAESEVLSERLRNAGIDCSVLNAKNDELEANIIAEAGLPDAVTISTNMAGRGTDIRLGGADERERARVLALGGLHVVASCRHESRRIDDQLRGRAGRQGDPGSSRMLVSLEDALVQRFGLVGMVGLERLGEGHPHAGREIARAQRIVEGQNFEIRRTLNQYSAVMEDQRRLIEARREAILQGNSEQRLLFDECSSRNEHLLRDLGPQALGEFQDQVMLRTLDLCWSDHLDRMAVIRRGIHLVQLAGRPPLDAFLRQAFEAFESLVETIEHESLRVYLEIGVGPEGVDWEGAGLLAPSATWTYTINDDRIESNLIRDLAYNPMILLGAVWMIPMLFLYALWQRLRNRSKKGHGGAGGTTAEPRAVPRDVE